jgi:hypothetical protein
MSGVIGATVLSSITASVMVTSTGTSSLSFLAQPTINNAASAAAQDTWRNMGAPRGPLWVPAISHGVHIGARARR